MRFILGGILGGAIATVSWTALEYFVGREFTWFSLVVGLLTGLGVMWIGDRARGGIFSGAVAAAITLLVIVSSKSVLAQVRMQKSFELPAVTVDTDAEPEEEEDTTATSTPTPEVPLEFAAGSQSMFDAPVPTADNPYFDMALYSGSCLLAYILGSSRAKTPSGAPSESSVAPAEPAAREDAEEENPEG